MHRGERVQGSLLQKSSFFSSFNVAGSMMADPVSNIAIGPSLYGRSNEMALLRQWYTTVVDATTSSNRTLLRVVSGPVGAGKLALIHSTLQTHVKQSNGLFLSGRFHSAQHDKSTGKKLSSQPYGAICEALNHLVCSLDNSNDGNVARSSAIRESLSAQFSNDGDREILSELVQSISQWLVRDEIGPAQQQETTESPSVSSIPPPFVKSSSLHMHKIQRDALLRIMQTIATHIPLVLHIEHFESADQASIELVEVLIDNKRTAMEYSPGSGLLLILSVVDESTLPDSIQKHNQQDHGTDGEADAIDSRKLVFAPMLRLRPLSRETIFTWVVEQFGRNDRNDHMLHEVTDMIHENSDNGNAQYIRLLLSYISHEFGAATEWTEDIIDTLHNTVASSRPNDIYLQILHNASPVTRNVVELIAALGEAGRHCVHASVLDIIVQQPTTAILVTAKEIGLLESADPEYCFHVPELQSVVYSLIPESKRASLHLRIGRKLWKQVVVDLQDPMTDENADTLDIVSRNLHLGLGAVTDTTELDIIVMMNLRAGKHAAMSSSFVAAAEYFEMAISALGNRAWTNDCYDISLALFNCASEAYYCNASYERMGETLDAVFENARTLNDKLQAYTTVIYANGARHRLKEALDIALDLLCQLDEPITTNPSVLTVFFEYLKTKRKIGRKSLRYFLSLPEATNEKRIAAMKILNFTMLYSYVINPYCGLISIFHLLQLCLKYGVAAPAIPAVGGYGYVNCVLLGNRQLGVQFGKIALALLEQSNAKKFFIARVHIIVHASLNHWGYPFRESLDPLCLASRSARKTGDIEGRALTAFYFLELSCVAGKALAPLENDARLACHEAENLGQVLGLLYLVPLWELVRDLMGSAVDPLHLQGTIADASDALNHAMKVEANCPQSQYYYMRTISCCLNAQYYDAVDMARKSQQALPGPIVCRTFYAGLAALAIARSVKGIQRWKYLSIGQRATKYVKKCATTCPSNYRNKQYLLEAEVASLSGHTTKAMALFNESIKKAYDEGFIHEVGLAYERIGQLQVYLGNSFAAVPLLESAQDAYNSWGAQNIVNRLEQQLTTLRGS